MRLLIVSPHPDDETLGAGGTLLKYKKSGAKIFWLNFTDMKEDYGFSSAQVNKRQSVIRKIISGYRVNGFYNFELRPAGLEGYPLRDLIKRTAAVVREVSPEVVILPFKNDIHSDHRIVFEAVYPCMKVFRAPSIKKVLAMEIVSETDFALSRKGFVPNYFVDISGFLERKLRLIKIYGGQTQQHPFPRSLKNLKALAVHRGATAGCKYAEGFSLLKEIA